MKKNFNTALERAINAGYRKPGCVEDALDSFDVIIQPFARDIVLLDKDFWIALGKSEDIEDYIEGYDSEGDYVAMPGWVDMWHQFIAHLANGGTVDDYFHKILKD
jgi:hypothetical protein